MRHQPPKISFEFFPPKSLQASFNLWESLNVLAPLNPEFVSVTYGAGGTTRQLTREMTETIGKNYGLDVAAHLTCVNASKVETLAIAKSYVDAGVKQIVALRGDAPKGSGGFRPHPNGFIDSVDLVAGLAAANIKTIHVGAYPEPHPEARHSNADIDWLKRKIDAGATSAITQFFLIASCSFGFVTAVSSLALACRLFRAFYPSRTGIMSNSFPASVVPVFQPALMPSLPWQNAMASRIFYPLLWRLISAPI